MTFQRSIAFPVIVLIVCLISVTTFIHYYIQVESLRSTFFSRNKAQAEQIHFMIQSLVDQEKEKLKALSYSLKENQELFNKVLEQIHHNESKARAEATLDRIYKSLNVDLLELIARDRRVLYRAHDQDRKGDFADHWGVDEALEGRNIMSTSQTEEGWGIRSFIPIYVDGAVTGAIMIGTVIDNEFAKNIARATGVDISIGTIQGLIATSNSQNRDTDIDFKTVILSLTENRQIYVEDFLSERVILYAPLMIVDEIFAFVVEIDTLADAMVIEQNKKQVMKLFVIILFVSLVIAIALTLYLIWPLKKLTKRAVNTVSEISGDTILLHKGNEVSRLVQSFNIMVQKIKDHLLELRAAEKGLREEKERLAVTLRSIGDAVVTADKDGEIQLINHAAESLTGWSQKEVVGKPLANFYKKFVDDNVYATGKELVSQIIDKNRNAGALRNSIFTTKDGSELVIIESSAPIVDEAGEILGVVLVFRDITKQKQLEEERIRAHQLDCLGTLAGGIAHDFNNILTAILGNASLASLFADADSRINHNLVQIEKAALQAKKLTQKLLTFSKGGAPIRETAVLTELIEDSANFILSGTNTQCDFVFSDDLWTAYVDKTQISQVIQNLCLNAHESMREGGTIEIKGENVVVTEKDTSGLRSGGYVKISVADHGRGISPDDLPKIFNPYFSTKRQGGGLGLSIVHSIIEKHGGRIFVESEQGKGAVFTFYIPAFREEVTGQGVKKDVRGRKARARQRILFMDDEEMLRDVVSSMLELLGYEVTVAANGDEAVRFYKQELAAGNVFDIVILDLTIPGGMGGRETIRELISIDPSVRAIVASGYSNDPVMAEYKKFGFKGTIIKPFDTENLKKTLDAVVQAKKGD